MKNEAQELCGGENKRLMLMFLSVGCFNVSMVTSIFSTAVI